MNYTPYDWSDVGCVGENQKQRLSGFEAWTVLVLPFFTLGRAVELTESCGR